MTYSKCNSLQLFSAQSMKMSMWYCGIALFYIFFNMSSFFLVYVCISVSLSFISPSLWKSLEVYVSLCYFPLFFIWLFLPFSASEFPLFVPYILDSSFNSLFSFNLEKDTLFYIHCFISDKQCDHSQLRNLLHFKLLPCKRGRAPPFYLLPWDSMRRNELDGNSNANGCHCWDWKIPWRRKWQCTPVFLPGKSHGWRGLVGYSPCGLKKSDVTEWLHFHFHFIYITSLIPKISYLEGLYCYILPFYQRGDWDTTWSYGLPKIAE